MTTKKYSSGNGKSVNQIVTENIVNLIESGKLTSWEKPFKTYKRNIFSKKDYSPLNQMLLMFDETGSQFYITPKQCMEHKIDFSGVKTHIVTFYSTFEKPNKDDKSKMDKKFVLRYYRVIGVDSLKESEEKTKLIEKYAKDLIHLNNKADIDLEKALSKIGFTVKPANCAAYSPSLHEIYMPSITSFVDDKAYYKTLFHEIVHWTGHKSVLNRHDNKKYMFDGEEKQNYSYEELVAELGSAMLSAFFNVDDGANDLKNSASYLKGWASKLKDDVNMIVSASGKAKKAVDLILSRMGYETKTEEEETAQTA